MFDKIQNVLTWGIMLSVLLVATNAMASGKTTRSNNDTAIVIASFWHHGSQCCYSHH